jgi:hypothetical protein
MHKAPRIPSKFPHVGPARPVQAGQCVRPQGIVQPKGVVHPKGIVQPKGVCAAKPHAHTHAHARTTPVAPPVYRPQAVPKVLQTKTNGAGIKTNGAVATPFSANKAASASAARPAVPTPFRPKPPALVAQAKVSVQRKPSVAGNTPQVFVKPHATAKPPVVQRATVVQRACVQPFRAGVIQSIKLYPNLHPGAVEQIAPNSIFRLEHFTDQYRLRKSDSHGVYVPNQQYNFVRTGAGEMLLHNRYRHPSIAEGRQVLYAGEVFFNNGKLEWWSNGSGHYQPDSEDAQQAALPMDSFYTYQQIIKGEHKRNGTRG